MSAEFTALLASVGVTSTEGLNVAVLENRLKDEIAEVKFVSACCEASQDTPLGQLGICSTCKDDTMFVPTIDGEYIC